jgi:hypothetical protein
MMPTATPGCAGRHGGAIRWQEVHVPLVFHHAGDVRELASIGSFGSEGFLQLFKDLGLTLRLCAGDRSRQG